ncbi:MAG: FprA family A-type flavoprotein [Muribaculaceae bacterium]|nr:FprA family A-type flavoprotein [Muribaculaceae bacterium]
MGLNQYLCNVNTIRYKMIDITESIKYIGVDDNDLDLFESQYIVPNGMAYNSYIILDEKIAVMDTVDKRKKNDWWCALEKELAGKKPDYLVVQHMEPDHAGVIAEFVEKYPESKIVATDKAIRMLPLFFEGVDFAERTIAVKENDTLSLGKHTLQFIMAPMVHWPEVMVTYEQAEKVLFSADAYGKFGVLSVEEDWACEARRYYFNICGKYGTQVQNLLRKASALEISMICPLHGPVLKENLDYYIGLYNTWSNYEPETDGVFIAYASIHGNTAEAANKLAEILREKGAVKVSVTDLSRCDMAEAVEDAFRMSNLVLAASSYDAGIFPPMNDFLHHLQDKSFQNRRVALIENGSWAPVAGKLMYAKMKDLKDIDVIEPIITIRGRMKSSDIALLEGLAEVILDK